MTVTMFKAMRGTVCGVGEGGSEGGREGRKEE